MNWTGYVDGYCERMAPGYWAEPINALTNLAFIIGAIVMWRRTPGLPLARLLCAILFAIGVGSYLFHTHAQVWAGVADVIPIVLFILTYIYVANRAYLELPVWASLIGAALFVPYAIVLTPYLEQVPVVAISAFYWPVPILIAIYAVILTRRSPRTAGGLALGAGILVVSLLFRSADLRLCQQVPVGTHFMWHILNGVMLSWMIEVYRRHVRGRQPGAPAPAGA